MKRFNTWHIITALLAVVFSCLNGQAEDLKPQGTSVEDIVPVGWLHHEAWGDLNKDGIQDLVVIATPDDEENILTRDDGYVYNFNPPILAIYFGNAQGLQQQWRRYDYVIPADDNQNCLHDIVLTITSHNTLRIAIGLFCSMGSYGITTDTYTYRYQKGDFYLIGMDREEAQRTTGECTLVSENYLTWKRQVVNSNIFEDTPVTEKWSRLDKKPLEKLGARQL